MTNCFDIRLHPDDVCWAAAEGVSEDVIAAVLLLHERRVDEIVPSLSAAELEQVIVLVGRSPRVYPPGTLDALKQRKALVSPEPPQRSGESARSDVAAGKQHARTPGADLRGQPETRTSARSDAGTDDRRSVIQVGSPQNAERHQTVCAALSFLCRRFWVSIFQTSLKRSAPMAWTISLWVADLEAQLPAVTKHRRI